MDAPLQLPLKLRPLGERGVALIWSIVAIVIVSMLAVSAYYLSSQDRLVSENFETAYRSSYAADEALSRYYAEFKPGQNISLPMTLTDDTHADDEGEDSALPSDEDDGLELIERSFPIGDVTLTVTPIKAMSALDGDVYMLETTALLPDLRNRPAAVRTIRTLAKLVPPFRPLAALLAPSGLNAKKNSDHLHLTGYKKSKCGSGQGVFGWMSPPGEQNVVESDKIHLKPDNYPNKVDTTSTTDYRDMLATMDVNWPALADTNTYKGMFNVIRVPEQYATINDVPYSNYSKTGWWPITLVDGDVNLNADKKGFGFLVITGSLKMTKKLEWAGVIVTGKEVTLTSGAHLHQQGLLAAGLGCTDQEEGTGKCMVTLTDKHLGIAYNQCNFEMSVAQLMTLQPLTPTRHTVLY